MLNQSQYYTIQYFELNTKSREVVTGRRCRKNAW